jgi:hypothetical protein
MSVSRARTVLAGALAVVLTTTASVAVSAVADAVRNGGTVSLTVGAEPHATWGTASADLPRDRVATR